ncbi:hypothetical protein FDECE_13112 [Fusarium decemcellulare]|nr:hypothetical protein FDECE_13112 [Fusarium decemcellulare]
MPPNVLQKLPVGLFPEIAQWLPIEAKRSFSTTSSAIRNTLSPHLFRTIRIRCPVSASWDVDEFLEKYSNSIAHVHLEIPFHPNTEDSEDSEDSEAEKEHPSIWGETPEISEKIKLLIGGQSLPKWSTLSVKFDPGQFEEEGEWDDEGIGSIHVFMETESWEEVEAAEKKYHWRAQYAEVWEAIAANTNIRRFDIFNLIPRSTQAWKSEEWPKFVARLEELNMTIFGGDNGAGWKAHRMYGFEDFMPKIADHFTSHADNVKRLGITAHEEGVIGTVHMLDCPIPLKKDMLPALYALRLENVAIDSDLLDFLKDHGDSLKELHLHNCMVCEEPSWAELWNHVREVSTRLIDLSVTEDKRPPLTNDEEFDRPPKDPEPEQVQDIRKKLEKDESIRLWRYVTVDDKYGMIFESFEEVIEHYEEDSEAYNALLDVLKKRNP